MVHTTKSVEEYKGEQYQLERREIMSLASLKGYRTVWCWEVLTGPALGEFGGKCGTKAEARKWARHAVREVGPVYEAQILQAHADGRHASKSSEDVKFWTLRGCKHCAETPTGIATLAKGRTTRSQGTLKVVSA